jgi:DNA-binding transcriptional ArsR family regulator
MSPRVRLGLTMLPGVNTKRPSKPDHLDLVFRALGDQTRRALLAQLTRGPAMVTELAEPFKMSLPAVSRHIRVLERARLVSRAVDGRVHRCSLRAGALRDAERWLSHYQCFWEGTLESLADYVDREKKPQSRRARQETQSRRAREKTQARRARKRT